MLQMFQFSFDMSQDRLVSCLGGQIHWKSQMLAIETHGENLQQRPTGKSFDKRTISIHILLNNSSHLGLLLVKRASALTDMFTKHCGIKSSRAFSTGYLFSVATDFRDFHETACGGPLLLLCEINVELPYLWYFASKLSKAVFLSEYEVLWVRRLLISELKILQNPFPISRAPNFNFPKISVRKTVSDLEFSEYLLYNFLLACLSHPRIFEHLKNGIIAHFLTDFYPEKVT